MDKQKLGRLIKEAKRMESEVIRLPDGYGMSIERAKNMYSTLQPCQKMLYHGAGRWTPENTTVAVVARVW